MMPPKRQTVVHRLKRRLEEYRRHQDNCLPRYDQTANGQYDAQRQETLLLKQRFLETKAKKTRRNDHHHSRNSAASANGTDQSQRNSSAGLKLKRQASSPLLDCAIENLTDGHPNKIARTEQPSDTFPKSAASQQTSQNQQQPGLPSFSVQIVQQFPNSNTTQPQTNVTVQGMTGGLIKTSNSPLPPAVVTTTASPGCVSSGASSGDVGKSLSNPVSNGSGANAVPVNTNVECKQEPNTDYPQCSVNGSLPLAELSNELANANNDVITTTTSSTAATTGDRFSDSLANLGFPEDSNDDVIHPDLLKDIIDDVFTNPSDIMNGFSFVDSLGLKDSNHSLDDEKDTLRPLMSLNKSVQDSPPSHFQNSAHSPGLFMNQPTQTVFDFPTGNVNSNATSQSLPSNPNTVQPGYASGRIGSYTATSPNMSGGLGLDFKLIEPSPAAQTLKQMAEQHQNMQQQKQQLGMGVSPRSPFGSDSFPDALSNIRSNFLSGSPNSIQKSPTGIFQSMGGFPQQQGFSGTSGNSAVKQEMVTPNQSVYTGNLNQHLSDMELHKRRQQTMQMQQQQNQMTNLTRPSFAHSPEQKRQYTGMRQLPMYNDPSPGHPPNEGSASNSPVPHHPSQFMRGVSTPGVTPPPPGFTSSPSPSSGTMHISQSQQIQLNANNQQLQLSQTHQQLLMTHDLKPVIGAQPPQQHVQSRAFYPGQTSVHMSQAQSLSFQFPNSARSRSPTTNQRPQPAAQPTPNQRHLQQHYMSRPPPDYQATVEPNSGVSGMQSALLPQGSQMQSSYSDMNLGIDQSTRNVELRNVNVSASKSYASMPQAMSASNCQPYQSIRTPNAYPGTTPTSNVPVSKQYSEVITISDGPSGNVSKPYSGVMSLSEVIQAPVCKTYSDNASIPVSRPFGNVAHLSSPNPVSVSKSFQDQANISNVPAPSAKSYGPILNPSSASMPKSFADVSTPNRGIGTSKGFQGIMGNSNAPSPYTVVSSVSLPNRAQSHLMPVTTMAPTSMTNKGRGKQVAPRGVKQCGPLHRQQKPPNVNVGPEGLNISQRPPVMTTDWRHVYIQQSQQQISNINAQLRMAYPRNTLQSFSVPASNLSNYQPHHINLNSPAGGGGPILSISPHPEHISAENVPEMNSVANNMFLQQQHPVLMPNDNILSASQLQLSTALESVNQSHQVFSPSSNSSQNIMSDGTNFNLDFLDNLDCSTSDLLNFDVMQGENTSFPLLEDMSMLDK